MPLRPPDFWDWHHAERWGGNCDTLVMQSPINIVAPVKDKDGSTGGSFFIDFNFEKAVPILITTNGVEIVVRFLEFAGAFKIIYKQDGTMLSFHPTHMSFRFPAEHLINQYRMDGEIVIVCEEVAPRDNMVIIYITTYRLIVLQMDLSLLFLYASTLKHLNIRN